MPRRKRITELERQLGEISADLRKARAAGDDTTELIKSQEFTVKDLVALHRPPGRSRRQLSLAQASCLAAVFTIALMVSLLLSVTGYFR